MITLNRYRYNEQRSCKDLTDVIESLNGKPIELVQDLSHHIADEGRHAMWLTDLLVDLGADIGNPSGLCYIDEFERLVDMDTFDSESKREDGIIAALTSINITEKRGCEYFSAHIHTLKNAPQTEENIKIRETLEKILPEEAGHIRWGNRWLAKLARKSPENRQKVEQAKKKYTAIEKAAYEAGVDIVAGAEIRRLNNLLEITKNMPLSKRIQYFMERLPQTFFSPDIQMTRLMITQKVWNEDPQALIEKFIPMFFNGLDKSQPWFE